jgi:hypothetical protein
VTPPHGALPAMRPAGLRLAGSPPVGSDIGELSLLCYEELDGVKVRAPPPPWCTSGAHLSPAPCESER